MNTIKESILGSVGAGKSGIEQRIKRWVEETDFTLRPDKRNSSNKWNVQIELNGNGIIFHIDTIAGILGHVQIFQEPFNSELYDPSWRFIKFVDRKGKLMDVDYVNCTVTNEVLPEESSENIEFIGCTIKCDHLPKGCKTVNFEVQHSLAGAHGCHLLNDWKNLKIDNVIVGYTAKGVSGLSSLSHFQNCTFTGKFTLTDNMLGYYSYDGKHRSLTEQAKSLLSGFLKHNKIDINQIIYHMPWDSKSYNEVASIVYDKKTDNFRVKK